jgi:hypothetical protein
MMRKSGRPDLRAPKQSPAVVRGLLRFARNDAYGPKFFLE